MNRREMLERVTLMVGGVLSPIRAKALESLGDAAVRPSRGLSQSRGELYNTNVRTLIGLGDKPAGIVDKYGQLLRSRHSAVRLRFGRSLQAAEVATTASQYLVDGYLPIIESRLEADGGAIEWNTFSSDHGGIEADYVEVTKVNGSFELSLLFPRSTSIRVEGGCVCDGTGKALALFPKPRSYTVHRAKYNLMTPETVASGGREGIPDPTLLVPNVDVAFTKARIAMLYRGIEYRFPVQHGGSYQVFLGVVPPPQAHVYDVAHSVGLRMLRLSVNEHYQVLDLGMCVPGQPVVREFRVVADGNELRIRSDVDVSTMNGLARLAYLSGIWVFSSPVDAHQVISGSLNGSAQYYVRCGQEAADDIASSVTLIYGGKEGARNCCIKLPYALDSGDTGKLVQISPTSARESQKTGWNRLLARGAELLTGNRQLDDLYRTSLINLLLLRTRFPGAAKDGQDIFVVKPGADWYDTFWTRDGSYICSTLDAAGLSAEAEESLRLLWSSGLTGTLAAWGQQPSGGWAAPPTEWDAQGQALWTLVNHYEFTRDAEWLNRVYDSLVKGARWIQCATNQSKIVIEDGDKPIYYGLLPMGSGEAIADGYNYYHCFWSILGLKQVKRAARALNRTADLLWISDLYDEFSENLLTSIKLAYERIGRSQYIPATPFDPQAPIWGSLAALYPTRFLDPHHPMITGTLRAVDGQAREDVYTYGPDSLWTYITVEGAMCHLLRDELDAFYRLYNGFVAHASPTNGWAEEISLPDRTGSGDMPHGWAAAQYVSVHRNALLFENERVLEFCWGVQPEWLRDGGTVSAKRAPTKFGIVDFSMRAAGSRLVFDYELRATDHEPPQQARLHIPQLEERIVSLRVNGQLHSVVPGQSVFLLSEA